MRDRCSIESDMNGCLAILGEEASGIDPESFRSKSFSFPRYLKLSGFEPFIEGHVEKATSGSTPEKHGEYIRFEEYCNKAKSNAGHFDISVECISKRESVSIKTPSSQRWMLESRDKANSTFTISPERIEQAKDLRTTCMIKNIPNRYTQEMLISLLNEDHFGMYDFVYLRMDFKNKCNAGYAFVNFNSPKDVVSFYRKVHGMGWRWFCSQKITELTYASIQGLEYLKRRFEKSTVMSKDESYRPKIFYSSGPLRGSERPFFS